MFRLVIPLILGICAGIYLTWEMPRLYWIGVCFLSVLGVLLLKTLFFNQFRYRFLFGAACFCLLLLFGTALAKVHQPQNDPLHYTSHQEAEYFIGKVISVPVEKERSYKVLLELRQVYIDSSFRPVSGKVLAYFAKEQFDSSLTIGDRVFLNSQIQEVDPPLNPGQFDYRKFLINRQIFGQIYLTANRYQKLNSHSTFSMSSFFAYVRENGVRQFEKKGFSGPDLAVVSALVLGVKDYLTDDVTDAFSGTGAMHVLAVSGLHVGVVYLLLIFLLNLIFGKNRSKLKALISVVALITYAGITGFSPSVLRATTMFAFIAAAGAFKEKTTIYNTLSASAVLLLLIDPYLITQVGFQLSYLAVLGIVYIQPKIKSLWWVRNKYLRKIWELSAVAIAAQIATFPLSLYYFNQFPNYFLLANLIVIPLAFLILYGGLAVLLLGWIPFLGDALAFVVRGLVKFLNGGVMALSELPFAVNENISTTVVQTLLLYLILLLSFLFIERPTRLRWRNLAVVVGVFLILPVVNIAKINKRREIVLYHLKGETALDFIHGRQHYFFCSEQLWRDTTALEFNVRPAWTHKQLFEPVFVSADSKETFHSPGLFVAGCDLLFFGKHVKLYREPYQSMQNVDLLVLQDTIWLNQQIVRDLHQLQPKQIVVDGSVPIFIGKNYEHLADSLQLPVWPTRFKGSLAVACN